MFLAVFLNFVISFCFTLGVMQIACTILSLATYEENKDYIPKWHILLSYNMVAALLISISYTIFINYAPIVYKQVKVNNGVIQLRSVEENFQENVVITIEKEKINYTLCNKNYIIKNNMYEFYNSMNSALLECSLPEKTEVVVHVVENPFKEIETRTTNSIIRRHVMN